MVCKTTEVGRDFGTARDEVEGPLETLDLCIMRRYYLGEGDLVFTDYMPVLCTGRKSAEDGRTSGEDTLVMQCARRSLSFGTREDARRIRLVNIDNALYDGGLVSSLVSNAVEYSSRTKVRLSIVNLFGRLTRCQECFNLLDVAASNWTRKSRMKVALKKRLQISQGADSFQSVRITKE